MPPALVDYLATLGTSPDALGGWTIATAQRGGAEVAFVITRGPEIHFVSLVGKRAMSRKNTIEHLAPIIETYGYATTRVPLAETDHRLRHALGFTKTWCDDTCSYWSLTALPYQKGSAPCPSL